MDLSKSWKFENSTTWNLNCLTMMDTKMISASELALYLLLTSLIHAPIEEQVKPIIPNSRKIKTSPCPHSYKSICDICDKSEDISISRPMKRTFADLESTIEDCDNNIIERTWGADGTPHIIDHQAKKRNFKDKSKEKTQPQVKQGSRAKPETGESSKSNSKAVGYDDEDNDPNKRRRRQSKGGENRERMSWTCVRKPESACRDIDTLTVCSASVAS